MILNIENERKYKWKNMFFSTVHSIQSCFKTKIVISMSVWKSKRGGRLIIDKEQKGRSTNKFIT